MSKHAGSRGSVQGFRWTTVAKIGSLPLVSIAVGPDPALGHMRGHARGVFAFGDIATGGMAIGGVARGLIAIGGVAIGGIALGGLAIGGLALGGAAIGGAAVGGLAVGYFALGGAAFGEHVVGPVQQDPEALDFFGTYAPWLLPSIRVRNRNGIALD
jgi:hypothetical protein